MRKPEPRAIIAAMKQISLELNYKWPIPYTGKPEDFTQSVRERLIAFNWVGCVKLLRAVYGKLDEVPNDFGAAFHGAFAVCCIALTVDVRKDSWKIQDKEALKAWGHGKKYTEKAVTNDTQDLMLSQLAFRINKIDLQKMLYGSLCIDFPELPKIYKLLNEAVMNLKKIQRDIRHEGAEISL